MTDSDMDSIYYRDCNKHIYWSDADNVQFLFIILLIFGEFWVKVIFIFIAKSEQSEWFPPRDLHQIRPLNL